MNNMNEEKKIKINTKEVLIEVRDWFISIIIALIIAFFIKYYIGTFTTVQQVSMYPTLENNQKIWLNRTVRTFGKNYKRGDIVTFESPKIESIYVSNENPKAIYPEVENKFVHNFLEFGKMSFIKRIIGMPGDKIQIKDGKVYVNGELKEESYTEDDTYSYKLTDFTVPENYYFLVGDNRDKSNDSRDFGCIPIDKIEGRASFSIWPFNKIGIINKDYK